MNADRLSVFGIFIVSAVALGFEIVMINIFGLVLPSLEVSLVIAFAMLGLASGGIASIADSGARWERRFAFLSLMMACSLAVATSCALSTEFITQAGMTDGSGFTQIWRHLFFVVPVFFVPFFCAGYIQAVLLKKAEGRFGMMYGLDLVGATFGSVAFPHLLPILHLKGTLISLISCSALPALITLATNRDRKLTLAVSASAALVLALSPTFSIRYEASPFRFYANRMSEMWTPDTRVARWKRMTTKTEFYVSGNFSFTDYKPAPWEEAKLLPWTVPLEAKAGGDILVIAAGAGPEVTAAHEFHAKAIDAVEISSALVEEMTGPRLGESGNPYRFGEVRAFASDIRTFLARNTKKYDVLIFRSMDSASLMSRFGNSIANTYIHTEEAVSEYLAALKPDGIFAFGTPMDGYSGTKQRDVSNPLGWYDLTYSRLVSIIAGLKRFGVSDPERHLVIYYGKSFSQGDFSSLMVLVSPTPFTLERVREVYGLLERRKGKVEVLLSGGQSPGTNHLVVRQDQAQLIRETISDVSQGTLMGFRKITDNRPYYAGSSLFTPGRTFFDELVAYRLRVSLIAVSLFLIVAIAAPMAFLYRRRNIVASARLTVAMIVTGLGFIMVEIAGIARFQIFLRNTIISSMVVLSAMILGAGLGSLHSAGLERPRKHLLIYSSLIALAVGGLFFLGGACQRLWMAMPFPMTVGTIGLAFLSLGFLMGHAVPLSIRAFGHGTGEATAFAWAVTSGVSVLGAILAEVVARDVGYIGVAGVAVGCYALLALVCARKSSVHPEN